MILTHLSPIERLNKFLLKESFSVEKPRQQKIIEEGKKKIDDLVAYLEDLANKELANHQITTGLSKVFVDELLETIDMKDKLWVTSTSQYSIKNTIIEIISMNAAPSNPKTFKWF